MKLPALILLLCATGAASAQQTPPAPPKEHRGPPQEAFDACKGKNDGDAAQATGPRGETMTGTCRMVLVPTRGEGEGRPGGRERPPRQ